MATGQQLGMPLTGYKTLHVFDWLSVIPHTHNHAVCVPHNEETIYHLLSRWNRELNGSGKRGRMGEGKEIETDAV